MGGAPERKIGNGASYCVGHSSRSCDVNEELESAKLLSSRGANDARVGWVRARNFQTEFLRCSELLTLGAHRNRHAGAVVGRASACVIYTVFRRA